MTRFTALPLSFAFILLSVLPAAAQPYDRPDWGGYGYMWDGRMFPGMGLVAAVVCLLALIGIAALIVWAVRGFSNRHGDGRGGHGHWALDILAERFARGEIDKTEFEDKRRIIGR